MAYTWYYSNAYNFGGYKEYRAWLGLDTSSTATTTTIKWSIGVQMKYGSLWGVAASLSGAASGSCEGYLSSSPGSSWKDVCRKDGSLSVTRGHSAVTKSFTSKAYGKTVSGYGSAGGSISVTKSVTVPAKASYAVSYNANGGSGAPGVQTKWYGETLTLSTKKPTRTGYTFAGWYTAKTGGSKYGTTYTSNSAATLYAHWTAITYEITYNTNAGTDVVENFPSNTTKAYGETKLIDPKTPIRTNWIFLGWSNEGANSNKVAFSPGDSYTDNKSLALYAIWQYNAYTISYDLNSEDASGTIPESQTKNIGTNIILAAGNGINAPAGYFLESWNTDSQGNGIRYELGQYYTSNIANQEPTVLYAQYKDSYQAPKAILTGSRIDALGDSSIGGKRIKLSCQWKAAVDSNGDYKEGDFILQYSDDYDPNVEEDNSSWTNDENNSFSFDGEETITGLKEVLISEENVRVGRVFRVTVTDKSGESAAQNTISEFYTIPEVDSTSKGVTIISNSFKISRLSSSSTVVNFEFQWTPYYDGNDYYIDSVNFTIKAIPSIPSSGEEETEISTSITGNYTSETKTGKVTGFLNIPVNKNAKFYITEVTSVKDNNSINEKLTSNFVWGEILYGGFPVHINSIGEGISLFGIADNLIGFEVNKATTLKGTLTVAQATNLNNALTVAGAANLNNTLTVAGNTSINGITNLYNTLNINGITVENLDNILNINSKIQSTGDIVANTGVLGYNVNKLIINLCDVDTALSFTTSYQNIPLRHFSGSNSWLTHTGNGIKVNAPCYVMVWGYFYVIDCNDNDAIYIAITNNNTIKYNTYFRVSGGNNTLSFLPMWVSCNKDDIIRVQIRNTTAARGQLEARSTFTRVNFQVVGSK